MNTAITKPHIKPMSVFLFRVFKITFPDGYVALLYGANWRDLASFTDAYMKENKLK